MPQIGTGAHYTDHAPTRQRKPRPCHGFLSLTTMSYVKFDPDLNQQLRGRCSKPSENSGADACQNADTQRSVSKSFQFRCIRGASEARASRCAADCGPLIKWESAVSRVLSRAIIHLGAVSPQRSSDLPGDSADHTIVPLFGLAPGGVYHAVSCYH